MKPEQQRIAIAEECGWTPTPEGLFTKDPAGLKPPYKNAEHLPDYLNDLNAMHEAEKVLNNAQGADYVKALDMILRRDQNANGTWEIHCACDEKTVCYRIFPFVHATAAQRAEAFLRTINKWEETK
jgi:hypothetical protein